jgi:hypothetical protein
VLHRLPRATGATFKPGDLLACRMGITHAVDRDEAFVQGGATLPFQRLDLTSVDELARCAVQRHRVAARVRLQRQLGEIERRTLLQRFEDGALPLSVTSGSCLAFSGLATQLISAIAAYQTSSHAAVFSILVRAGDHALWSTI